MDVVRQAAGLPIAALFPLAIPATGRRWFLAALAALLYAGYVMLPAWDEPLAWVAIILVVNATVGIHFLLRRLAPAPRPREPFKPTAEQANRQDDVRRSKQAANRLLLVTIGSIAILALLPVVLLHKNVVGSHITAALMNDRIFLCLNGAVAAVFVGGMIVGNIVLPLAEALPPEEREEGLPELLETSTHIGWLERFLFFTLFAGGAADAAALALAAKAFVRAPVSGGPKKEPLVKFYLVGTLASVGVALAAAMATRLSLGLSPI